MTIRRCGDSGGEQYASYAAYVAEIEADREAGS